MLRLPSSVSWSKQPGAESWSLRRLVWFWLLLGINGSPALTSDSIAPAPFSFTNNVNYNSYFVSIELGGPEAAATQYLIDTTNKVVSSALGCPPNGCQVVEAKNITSCHNLPPADSPMATANLSSSQDEELLAAFLQDKNSSSVEVKQWSSLAPAPKRHLLAGGPTEAPLPGDMNCTTSSELTMYLTFPVDPDSTKWNQTVALFSGGIYLSKMQRCNFDLETVTLLSYQELGASPQGSQPIANLVISESTHIPGPKPAVMNNDSTPGPVSFTLSVDGIDALVTNDTLLNVVYNMLTNTSLGGPGNHWFSPMNTVISSVVQNEQPRRLARRSLMQAPGPPSPSPAPDPCTAAGYPQPPSLSITTKLFQVPRLANGQVEALVQSLVDSDVLLNGFLQSGLRICRVTLTSFTGDGNSPAPSPSLPVVFSTRSSSNHSVVVVALSIAIPVSIVGTAFATLAVMWYRRNRRKERDNGLRAKKFSGESSLFGSPLSTAQPEASAQSIIRSLHANSFSSKSRLFDMPWSDWKIDPSELTIAHRPDGSEWLLGSGASGKVYKALRNGVQIVAVKVFKEEATLGAITSLTSPHHAAMFKQEISILKNCHDKNIVQFVGACLTVGQPILVTEYLENGDLYKAINSQQGNRYHWYRMQLPDARPLPNSGMGRRVALDVARGLHFLHTRKIVHFDLKSANILLARDFTAKIADVGLARILHDDVLSSRKEVGTFAWAAPEVLLGRRVTEAADIYSFGVLLHELSAVESPQQRQLRQLTIPDEAPIEIADLINRCLDVDPLRRPTARELVAVLTCMPAVPPYPPPPSTAVGPQTQLLCPANM